MEVIYQIVVSCLDSSSPVGGQQEDSRLDSSSSAEGLQQQESSPDMSQPAHSSSVLDSSPSRVRTSAAFLGLD